MDVKKQMYDNSETPNPPYQLENLSYEDIRFIAEKCYESMHRYLRGMKNHPDYVNSIMNTSRFQIVKQIYPRLLRESGMRYSLESMFDEMQGLLEYDFKEYINIIKDSNRKEELKQRRITNIELLKELLEIHDKQLS